MKVVIDTNVFISGIFWSGPPYQILKAWQNHKIRLVLSQEILNEYDRVAYTLTKQYPHVDLLPFIELLAMHAEMYTPVQLKQPLSRDPNDDMFIACALAAKAKIIISGDKDLLTISGVNKITILKPSAFVMQYLSKDDV